MLAPEDLDAFLDRLLDCAKPVLSRPTAATLMARMGTSSNCHAPSRWQRTRLAAAKLSFRGRTLLAAVGLRVAAPIAYVQFQ